MSNLGRSPRARQPTSACSTGATGPHVGPRVSLRAGFSWCLRVPCLDSPLSCSVHAPLDISHRKLFPSVGSVMNQCQKFFNDAGLAACRAVGRPLRLRLSQGGGRYDCRLFISGCGLVVCRAIPTFFLTLPRGDHVPWTIHPGSQARRRHRRAVLRPSERFHQQVRRRHRQGTGRGRRRAGQGRRHQGPDRHQRQGRVHRRRRHHRVRQELPVRRKKRSPPGPSSPTRSFSAIEDLPFPTVTAINGSRPGRRLRDGAVPPTTA